MTEVFQFKVETYVLYLCNLNGRTCSVDEISSFSKQHHFSNRRQTLRLQELLKYVGQTQSQKSKVLK